eukprot:243625_1
MYQIYDAAFTEVWRLIQTDSFLRFKGTDDFRRLASVLFPEAAKEANQHLIQMVDEAMEMEKRERLMKKERQIELDLQKSHNPIEKAQETISLGINIPKLLHAVNGSVSLSPHHRKVNNNDFATALTSIAEDEAPHTPILNDDSLVLQRQRSLPSKRREMAVENGVNGSDESRRLKLQKYSHSLPSRGPKDDKDQNVYRNMMDSIQAEFNRLYSDSRRE